MAEVIIGIDPHKGSHTAFVIDVSEQRLGQLRVRASVDQLDGLREWAQRWPDRVRAIEGANGLGHLLAQQLLAPGERVVDMQPKLAARVRLLNTGQANKNDPNDARSVAIAALRSPDVRAVAAEDHAAALKVWARRHRDLSRSRNRTACPRYGEGGYSVTVNRDRVGRDTTGWMCFRDGSFGYVAGMCIFTAGVEMPDQDGIVYAPGIIYPFPRDYWVDGARVRLTAGWSQSAPFKPPPNRFKNGASLMPNDTAVLLALLPEPIRIWREATIRVLGADSTA